MKTRWVLTQIASNDDGFIKQWRPNKAFVIGPEHQAIKKPLGQLHVEKKVQQLTVISPIAAWRDLFISFMLLQPVSRIVSATGGRIFCCRRQLLGCRPRAFASPKAIYVTKTYHKAVSENVTMSLIDGWGLTEDTVKTFNISLRDLSSTYATSKINWKIGQFKREFVEYFDKAFDIEKSLHQLLWPT